MKLSTHTNLRLLAQLLIIPASWAFSFKFTPLTTAGNDLSTEVTEDTETQCASILSRSSGCESNAAAGPFSSLISSSTTDIFNKQATSVTTTTQTLQTVENHFTRKTIVTPVNESIVENNPEACDTTNFLTATGLNTWECKDDEERYTLGGIFSNTRLVTKYDLLDSNVFIYRQFTELKEKLEDSFDRAFEFSALAAFGKNMRTIRPFIAYAQAVSSVVEHYEVDEIKAGRAIDTAERMKYSVIQDSRFTIDDTARQYLGGIFKPGEASLVTQQLGLTEFSFEEFLVETRIWSLNSIGTIYDIVKNLQHSMQSSQKQIDYFQQALKFASVKNEIQQKQFMDAVMYQHGQMLHYLTQITPGLVEMTKGIEKLTDDIQSGIMTTLRAATKQTQKEITQSEKEDMKRGIQNTMLTNNIKSLNNWLEENRENIDKHEKDISKMSKQIHNKIEEKTVAIHAYEGELRKLFEKKKRYVKDQKLYHEKFMKDIKAMEKDMLTMNIGSQCRNSGRTFVEELKKCQRTSTSVVSVSSQTCTLCMCAYSKYRFAKKTDYTQWTDRSCYDRTLAKHRALAQAESRRCRNFQVELEKAMTMTNKKMEAQIWLYGNQSQLISNSLREQDELKLKHQEVLQDKLDDIDEQRKKLNEKRSKLYVLQENAIKGDRLGKVLKDDLVNKLGSFDNYAQTLELTQLALDEVFTSLKKVYFNLKKFKVQLEALKNMIKNKLAEDKHVRELADKFDVKNAMIFNDNIKKIYDENLKTGMGMIVIAKMYHGLYDMMTHLKDYPIGLYDPKKNLQQNIRFFNGVINNMNGNSDFIQYQAEVESNNRKQASLNKQCKKTNADCELTLTSGVPDKDELRNWSKTMSFK